MSEHASGLAEIGLVSFGMSNQSTLSVQYDPKHTRQLIRDVIASGEDHEFYPTTTEIIEAMASDLKSHSTFGRFDFTSILDVGAGSGKVLLALKELGFTDLFAIEKSTALCQAMDPSIMIVGTTFEAQSLLSKRTDILYSNPPYSQFNEWSVKIIRQAASKFIYLVIPQRWRDSEEIKDAIRFREASCHTVGSFDFMDAEDRKARAKVDLLRIDLRYSGHSRSSDDAFDRFFAEQFSGLINKFKEVEKEEKAESDGEQGKGGGRYRTFHKLVVGPDYPAAMEALYNQEMANIQSNYSAIADLDVDLMREFEMSPARILGCLKQRLTGLKHDYWSELFSHINTVTDRLTSSSRQKLLDKLQMHTEVDFSVSNICAVMIWLIKNANQYIDSQLLKSYEVMVDKANVYLYKSNHRTFVENRWRYASDKSENTHFALDYRIVTYCVGGIGDGKLWGHKGLKDGAAEFIRDLLTIARNLGFHCETQHADLSRNGIESWMSGQVHLYYFTKNEKRDVLFEVKAFKNGNLHFRMNKSFMMALNVEHGRLRGWLRSASEAVEEMGDLEAADYFKANMLLPCGDPALLLT